MDRLDRLTLSGAISYDEVNEYLLAKGFIKKMIGVAWEKEYKDVNVVVLLTEDGYFVKQDIDSEKFTTINSLSILKHWMESFEMEGYMENYK